MLNIVPKKREHVSSYNTRNKEDYIFPRCRLQLFRTSFVPDAVKQWNLLKVEVQSIHSGKIWKKKLKIHHNFFFILASDIPISFIQSWDITVY